MEENEIYLTQELIKVSLAVLVLEEVQFIQIPIINFNLEVQEYFRNNN